METLKKFINWTVVILAFLLPLFFLPITSEFFIFNKQALLILVTGALAVACVLKITVNQTFSLKKAALDLPVILFALAIILATIFASPNRPHAFLEDGLTLPILTLSVFYFILTNNLAKGFEAKIIIAVLLSGAILGLIAIYQFIGLGEAMALAEWLKNPLFTPAGGPLILISYLVIALIPAVILFLRKFNHQDWAGGIGFLTITLLIVLGLVFTLYQVWPGQPNRLLILPYRSTWAIAIEALKQAPLFGVGPGNYVSAFNRFRPLVFNQSQFWHLRFGIGSSFPFHLLTVGGLVVLTTFILFLGQTFKLLIRGFGVKPKDDYRTALLGGILTTFLLTFFIPINLLVLFLAFLFIGLLASQTATKSAILTAKTLGRVLLAITVIAVGSVFYLYGRVYAAEISFRKSLEALARNEGIPTYNHQVRAIDLNRFSPLYRRSFSQTNLALVNALVVQPDLSDQDRARIIQLVQQAIREAKAATALNPTDAVNWENLAQIYRNLLNFAQGADQWTIASYQQAIQLDPVNPRIRLNLGGLFFGLGNFEAATIQFQNAVNLKPDWANAYYNLAATYREQERYQEAYQAMQIVLNLVPIDSEDYRKAKEEFDALAKKLPAPEEAPAERELEEQEALTEPQPLPSPVIEPPLELPEGAGPEVSPTPEAEATPTPTP